MLAVVVCGSASGQAPSASGNDALNQYHISLPQTPTLVERTAGEELQRYLELATGNRLPIKNGAVPNGPALVIGGLERGESLGVDTAGVEDGGVLMRTQGDRTYLLGHGKTAPLIATYVFLEEAVGVIWFNNYGDESVPDRPAIDLASINSIDNPGFDFRDGYSLGFHKFGKDNYRLSLAQSRLNGDQNRQYASHQYYKSGSHTLYLYIDPETYFASHPEYFSLVNGKRTHTRAQLCFSNEQLRAEFTRRVLEEMWLNREGGGDADLFSISVNDYPGELCECGECRALVEQYGTRNAPLYEYLVQNLSPAVAEEYPENQLQTLAYRRQQGEVPPRGMRFPDNVIVMFCFVDNDFADPLSASSNRPTLQSMRGWLKSSDHVWVWYYTNPYGPWASHLPFDVIDTFAQDVSLMHKLGVKGIFLQNDASRPDIFRNHYDVTQWMLNRLVWDPDADVQTLLEKYTDRFYGSAAPQIHEYLELLHTAARQHPSDIYMMAQRQSYRYLTPDLLRKAHELFDEAEAAASEDPTRLHRVRTARLSLYFAELIFSDELSLSSAERDKIAADYRIAYSHALDSRVDPGRADAALEYFEELLAHLLKLKSAPPTTAPVPGGRQVAHYTAFDFCTPGGKANLVDPTAAAGMALTGTYNAVAGTLNLGTHDYVQGEPLLTATIPASELTETYKWFRVGACEITENTTLWLTDSWAMSVSLSGVSIKSACEIHVSIKKLAENGVALDRVMLIRK